MQAFGPGATFSGSGIVSWTADIVGRPLGLGPPRLSYVSATIISILLGMRIVDVTRGELAHPAVLLSQVLATDADGPGLSTR